MLQTTSIPLVDIEGFGQREFQIQVSQHNLRQYGLSLQDIANVIGQQNLDMPAGDLNTGKREYQIRFNDEKRSIEALAELVVLQGNQHAEVRLGDIATIVNGFDNDENQVTFNGKPAAFLKSARIPAMTA